MPVKPHSTPTGLSEKEAAQLELLTCQDEAFLEMIDGLAHLWKTKLRDRIADPAQCRKLMLAHTTVIAARHAIIVEAGPRLALALSLVIIDRVEERVAQLDREEKDHAG